MILGVIPARLDSTRFPNKIIFPLNGKPIIEHVYDKAIQSKLLSKVVVAIDSQKTKESINCSNIIMTSDKHQSGTDRVAEVSKNYNCDIVSFCPCDIRYAFRNEFMLPSITASTFPVSWAVLTSFTNLYGCIT